MQYAGAATRRIHALRPQLDPEGQPAGSRL